MLTFARHRKTNLQMHVNLEPLSPRFDFQWDGSMGTDQNACPKYGKRIFLNDSTTL